MLDTDTSVDDFLISNNATSHQTLLIITAVEDTKALNIGIIVCSELVHNF